MAIKDYIRERFFPHIWCPGCGHGMVLNGLLRAIEEIGLDKNEIVMVSGIGCSARIFFEMLQHINCTSQPVFSSKISGALGHNFHH